MSPIARCILATLLVALLSPAAPLSAQINPLNLWTGAISNQWATGGNWSLGHSPTSTEDAHIANGSTVIAAGTITCSHLYVTGSTLRANGDIDAITVAVSADATMILGTNANRGLKCQSLSVNGTLVWEGGDIDGQLSRGYTSTISIQPLGTFIDQANGGTIRNALRFNCSGTFWKQTGSSAIAVPSQISGALNATSGAIEISQLAAILGPFHVNASAGASCTLATNSSEYLSLSTDAQFAGAGLITLDGFFNGRVTGTVSAGNHFGGAVTIAAGSTVRVQGANGEICLLKGSITNHGTLQWNCSRGEPLPAATATWASITNASDGVFENGTNSESSITIAEFTNYGIFRKLGTAELALGSLSNTGSIEVQSGRLLVTDIDSNNGPVRAAVGTSAEFRTVGDAATLGELSTFTGDGEIVFNGSFSGTLVGKARLHENLGGGLSVESGSTVTIDEGTGNTLAMPGSLIIRGTCNWSSGNIVGSVIPPFGSIEVQAGGHFNILSPDACSLSVMLSNSGTIEKKGGSGTADLQAGINNQGTIQIEAGTVSFAYGFQQSAGQTILDGGTLATGQPAVFMSGSLSGNGTINGSVWLTGATLGLSASQTQSLHITGSLEVGGSSTVSISAVGTAPGEFGHLLVDNSVSLSGTLAFTTPGYEPSPIAQFPIITGASLTGSFANISFPEPPANTHYSVKYSATTATIAVVPPPYAGWQYSHFGTETDPDIIGETADPDGDGVINLVEYAFGLDPLSAASTSGPNTSLQYDGMSGFTHLFVSYHTPADADDISISAEESTDLVNWRSGIAMTMNESVIEGFRHVTLRSSMNVEYSPGRSFIRLRVTKIP